MKHVYLADALREMSARAPQAQKAKARKEADEWIEKNRLACVALCKKAAGEDGYRSASYSFRRPMFHGNLVPAQDALDELKRLLELERLSVTLSEEDHREHGPQLRLGMAW